MWGDSMAGYNKGKSYKKRERDTMFNGAPLRELLKSRGLKLSFIVDDLNRHNVPSSSYTAISDMFNGLYLNSDENIARLQLARVAVLLGCTGADDVNNLFTTMFSGCSHEE